MSFCVTTPLFVREERVLPDFVGRVAGAPERVPAETEDDTGIVTDRWVMAF
jgi:hypothetical protein